MFCWPRFCGCTWVGGSTHWVGLRSCYDSSPLFRGLMEFNTQTHWTEYIIAGWASAQNWNMQTWLMSRRSVYCLIYVRMLKYLTFLCWQYHSEWLFNQTKEGHKTGSLNVTLSRTKQVYLSLNKEMKSFVATSMKELDPSLSWRGWILTAALTKHQTERVRHVVFALAGD